MLITLIVFKPGEQKDKEVTLSIQSLVPWRETIIYYRSTQLYGQIQTILISPLIANTKYLLKFFGGQLHIYFSYNVISSNTSWFFFLISIWKIILPLLPLQSVPPGRDINFTQIGNVQSSRKIFPSVNQQDRWHWLWSLLLWVTAHLDPIVQPPVEQVG